MHGSGSVPLWPFYSLPLAAMEIENSDGCFNFYLLCQVLSAISTSFDTTNKNRSSDSGPCIASLIFILARARLNSLLGIIYKVLLLQNPKWGCVSRSATVLLYEGAL